MSRKKPAAPKKPSAKSKKPIFVVVAALVAVIGFAVFAVVQKKSGQDQKPKAEPVVAISGPVTFARHAGPIIFQNCAPCHQPGQAGPFDLLTYEDARKRGKDIVRVTQKRIMPPWLPAHGYGEFKEERRLTDQQIAILQRWVDEGAVEGDPAELPPPPIVKNEWRLGEPDLVLQPQPYTLPGEGRDVYFNFVVPIPITSRKYVSGVELLSGSRVVHHAFINIDETQASRRRAAKFDPPGFPGMEQPDSVVMPGGQLLGWQPGKIPSLNSQGLAWTLRTNTDLVLQVHMNPSGKPEIVQPKVGFHFTDQAPTNVAFRLRLTSLLLDIPAGESNYVTETSYTLPVDVSMVRVGAHAHYLAKDMQGFAILPNGEKKWLLWIKDWDFKWQGDYEYKEPVHLPKGSKVMLRFTYDNSTNNVRNPFNPPKRVFWGLETLDEMGELYFQAMPANLREYQILGADYSREFLKTSLDFYRFRVQLNPADSEFQQRLGRALAAQGDFEKGISHLLQAIRAQPTNDLAHFDLGSIYLRQKRIPEAYNEFVTVTRLNPDDAQAFGSLGIAALQLGRLEEAREFFARALRLNPEDALALQYLQRLNAQQR